MRLQVKIQKVCAALLLVISLVSLVSPARAAEKVSSYRPVFKPYYDTGGRLLIAIRSFSYCGVDKTLSVDPQTFESFILDASKADATRVVRAGLIEGSAFTMALERYTAAESKLHNSGITHGECQAPGLFLTVDMCPSRKEFDKDLFTTTESLNPGSPVPLAIAVSGLWIEQHTAEFNWLLDEQKAGRLAVTWVNHTYSHPYDPRKPDTVNFLLTPGVDFEDEVLRQETTLINHGGLPSPFFRFPGLVSSDALLARLKTLSLIPVGADAWIAKRQAPVDCSIILVHGNGNEPEGVRMLIDYFRNNSPALRDGGKKLLPLKDALKK